MSLSSMTGFARKDGGAGDLRWVIEVKSVNGRGLEVKGRYPSGFEAAERLARETAKARLVRGTVNVSVNLSSTAAKAGLSLNADALAFYLEAITLLDRKGIKAPRADGLLSLRGVVEAAGNEGEALSDDHLGALQSDIEAAFDALKAARDAEGRAIEAVLKAHLETLTTLAAQARTLAGLQTEAVRERFVRRVTELSVDTPVEPERVLQEAAVLATKADVREELDRLDSHIAQAHSLIDTETAPGRKLDFLSQEFMRESNTLCSKSAHIDLTRRGLELKAVVDQFREQVQNVE